MKAQKFVPLVVRQMRRNPRRSILTFLGLAVSFFLFTGLESNLYTMHKILNRTGGNISLFIRPKYGIPFYRAELPQSYLGKVKSLPGVAGVTPYLFYVGKGRIAGQPALALGADPDTVRIVRDMKGVTDEEYARFRQERTAAIVGETTLAQNAWKVGDQVTIQSLQDGKPLTFRIVGDADGDGNFGGVAVMHLDYLQDVINQQGKLTFIILKADSVELAPALAGAIDSMFANFTVATETISENQFLGTVLGGLSDALGAITLVGYLTLFATVLVVANTVAMSIRERTTEIGMLRTLGFGKTLILGLVLAEALVLSGLGALAGSGSCWALFASGVIKFPPEMGGITLQTNGALLAKSLALSLVVGGFAGLQPAWSASRMPITEALRHAD